MKVKEATIKLINEIENKKDQLTELDRKIGDADHGYNLALGFKKVKENLTNLNGSEEIMAMIGNTLLATVGGASGPLYGMAFISGSKGLSTNKELSFSEFKTFVEKAVESLAILGRAKIGQKTMVDVWIPFSNFLKTQKELDKEILKQKLRALKNATKNMEATIGRASYLGPRSKGTIDPGAASSEIMLRNLLEAIND